jgi:subtilisin family serine protease
MLASPGDAAAARNIDETPMTWTPKRKVFRPSAEALEHRTLLSVAPATLNPPVERFAQIRAHAPAPHVARALKSLPGKALRTVHVAAAIPNDPQFSALWGLSNPNNVDIDAPEAWRITTGRPSVIVAVIDSGIDLNHPDLAAAIWTNPNEVAGNGIDDDGDGLVDDVHGWNFINDTANVQDDLGHGTHVSGTIGAIGNNGIGVVGVATGVTIMPLKFIGPDGNGSIDDAVRAIYYAVDHGARVINASWGGSNYSPTLDAAIRYASAHDVVFVTASGNEGIDNDQARNYPALERLPNVLSVAAVDATGRLAPFSNYGIKTVDLAAPGVKIRSTIPGGYDTYTGTSMASPHVTGVVALLAGLHPELSAQRLVDIILATAKPIPGVAMKTVTGGMVDAYQALAADPRSTFFTPPNHVRRVRIAHLRIYQPRVAHVVRKPIFRPSAARLHA